MSQGKAILLVDDDRLVRTMAHDLLESYGFAVVEAGSGTVAVEKYRAEPERFGVVLLDLVMPHPDGVETLKQLRRIDPGVRVILWSAYARSKEAQALIEDGKVPFLRKPADLDKLVDTVASQLGERGGADE